MENLETAILKKLGVVIRDYRILSGLSQEKFALKIEMDRTYYSGVENGKRNISIRNLLKIANGLNISVTTLFLKAKI